MSKDAEALKTELDAGSFINFFKNGRGLQDKTIVGDVELSNFNSDNEYQFANCSFKNLVVKGIQFRTLDFYNCQFKELRFTDIRGNFLRFSGCSSHEITIKNSTRLNSLIVDNKSKFNNIGIIGGEFIKLEFTDSLFELLEIKEINHGQTGNRSITISESPIPKGDKIPASKIRLEALIGQAYFHIKNSTHQEFSIVKCNGLTSLSIDDSKIISIPITDSNLGNLNFKNSKIESLKFMNGNLSNLNVLDGEFSSLEANKVSISTYSFQPSNPLFSQLRIKDLILNELTLGEKSSLNIKHLDCDLLSINGITNDAGEIKISDSQIHQEFSFEKGKLGKAIFSNLNLQDCSNIKTLNSSFTDSKFFNVQWRRDYRVHEYPNEIEKCETNDKRITNYFYPLRESYRQLISVSNKELNKIDSLFFQKQELRIYFEIIKFDKWKSWVNFQDYLVLGSNKLFSDFGQNVWLPLKWWIPVHGVLFLLLIQTHELGVKLVNPKDHSWTAFRKGLGIFLNLLNPIHSAEIYKVNIYGLTDFSMRIVAGYFLYYFINATRKFHLQK